MSWVHEINDFSELAGYRLRWESLLAETPGATFFHSLDWLEVFWRHYGHDRRLRALIVFSGGQPIGILPLVVLTEHTRAGRVQVLTYPLHGWGTFYGPIGPNPAATLLSGMRHLRHTRRDWDLVDLRWVDGDGSDRGRTPWSMRAAGFDPRKQVWEQAPVVQIKGTWEDYWMGRPKKWRDNLLRMKRRLAEQGEITHLRYRPAGAARGDGDPRWELYDDCVRLAGLSWQGSSIDGTTLCHASVRQYLRDTHAVAAKTGSLDLNLLLMDGVPVAFLYNYCHRGSVYGLRMGYDPRAGQYAPGTVLLGMAMEDSFRRGDHLYDLGVGYPSSKRCWPTAVSTSYRYTHYARWVPQAQALRLKHWFNRTFRGAESAAGSSSA